MWATARCRISPKVLVDQWVTEWPWHDPLSKGVDYQSLIQSLELYYERPKPVQEILQRFSLSLFHTEKVERDRRLGLVDDELFPEQSRKLIERGDVAVWEANKPL